MGISASGIDILAGYDFQMSNLWDFFIFTTPLTTNGSKQSLLSNTLKSLVTLANDSLLAFKVVSTNIPFSSLTIDPSISGHKFYSARVFPENFKISIMEDTFFNTYQFFDNWLNSIYDFDNNKFQYPSLQYNGSLIYYSGLGVPSATFKLEDMKLTGLEPLNPTRGDSVPLVYEISFAVTKVVFEPGLGNTIQNNVSKTISSFTNNLIK